MHFKLYRSPRRQAGLTLVEVMVTMSILSTILVGLVMSSIQFGKSVDKVRNYVMSRKDLSSFIFSITSFTNKSLGAYFYDTASSTEFDYLAGISTLPAADPMLNDLYLLKDGVGATGLVRYSPVDRTISWIRIPGATPVVMLANVVRPDYQNESDTGSEPIFKFPHRSSLYYTSTNPKFVMFNFKVLVNPDVTSDEPVTLPVTLALKLNAIDF